MTNTSNHNIDRAAEANPEHAWLPSFDSNIVDRVA